VSVWSAEQAGIVGLHLRKGGPTTIPDQAAAPVPDLLQRDFSPGAVDERWCGSGSRRESHPPAPTEPCVIVSHYTALAILVTKLRDQRQ
jgi:hypothetical protein